MVASTNKDLLKLKKELTRVIDAVEGNSITSEICLMVEGYLRKCEKVAVTVNDLTTTQIGKIVNEVRKIFKSNTDISDLCKKITDKWKEAVLEHRQIVKENIKKRQDGSTEIYMSQDFSNTQETTLEKNTEVEQLKLSHKRTKHDSPQASPSKDAVSKTQDSFSSFNKGYTSKTLPYFNKLAKSKSNDNSASKGIGSIVIKEEPKSDEEGESRYNSSFEGAKADKATIESEPSNKKVLKDTVAPKKSRRKVAGDIVPQSLLLNIKTEPIDTLHHRQAERRKTNAESQFTKPTSKIQVPPSTNVDTVISGTIFNSADILATSSSSITSAVSSTTTSGVDSNLSLVSTVVCSTPSSSTYGRKDLEEYRDASKTQKQLETTPGQAADDLTSVSFSQFILNRQRVLSCKEGEPSGALPLSSTTGTGSVSQEHEISILLHTNDSDDRVRGKDSDHDAIEATTSTAIDDEYAKDRTSSEDNTGAGITDAQDNANMTLTKKNQHKFARCIANVREILTNTVSSLNLMEHKMQLMKTNLHNVQGQVHTLQQIVFGNQDPNNTQIGFFPRVLSAKKRKQKSFHAAKRSKRFKKQGNNEPLGNLCKPPESDKVPSSSIPCASSNSDSHISKFLEGERERNISHFETNEEARPVNEPVRQHLLQNDSPPNIDFDSNVTTPTDAARDVNDTITSSIPSSSVIHEGSRVPVSLRVPRLSESPQEKNELQGKESGMEELMCFTQVVDDMEISNDLPHDGAEFLREQRQKYRKSWNDVCKKEEGIHYSPLGKNRGVGALKALHKRTVAKEAIKQVLNRQRRGGGRNHSI